MTKIRLFPCLIFVVMLLAACAPAPAPEASSQPASGPSPTILPVQNVTAPLPTEVVIPSPLPVATSRGPELHATDPGTVNLASGGLQLVEFFRFT